MRPTALIAVVLTLTALVLSFLCLFAGSKPGFMEDYAVVTLNTSRIGENIFNTSSSSSGSNIFTSFIHNATNTIEGDLNSDLNSLARQLGVHDFYSAHILDYCEGFFTPTAVPNTTFPASSIHKNVTACSNKTAMFHFDPNEVLQRELNASGHGVNLTELHWPSEVGSGLAALHVAQGAAFVLYCIAIGFISVALCLALVGVIFDGRLSAFLNVFVHWLASLAIGLASAVSTAIAVKAADVINHYGNEVGISASKGGKFLIITWITTAVMLVASIVWCGECVVGPRRNKHVYSEGPGYKN